MSQTKYHMPEDVKTSCIALVKGYKRRVKLYHEKRDDIIYASPSQYETYIEEINGKQTECRSYISHNASGVGRPVENKHEQLLLIESHPDTVCMRAVEQSLVTVGADFVNEEDGQILRDAIMSSCIKGRDFNFYYWPLPVGKTNFYERRRGFLYRIAIFMDYL